MQEKEVWKQVRGYEGIYEVSDIGNIKSLTRKVRCRANGLRVIPTRTLKNSLNDKGYYRVNLPKETKHICFLVHRLVGIAFIPNPENKRTINHKNGITTDNRVCNLEWNTDLENMTHSREVLGNRYNMRRLKNINTGKVYDNLNEVLLQSDCLFSKPHMSGMLNGHYPNKTPYIFIE